MDDLSVIQELSGYLQEFVLDRRFQLIDRVLPLRTRYVTVLLEDIFQSQNASAVMRTCDCVGIQDLYIAENQNTYTLNPWVVRGSDKWVTRFHFNTPDTDNTLAALQCLKQRGYRILATALHHRSCSLEEFDVTQGKFAVVYGNEGQGVSQTVLDHADACIRIPMFGFTESFNISVAAGISLYTLMNRVRQSCDWELPELERARLRLAWLCQSVRSSSALIRRFAAERGYSAEKLTKMLR